MTDQPFLANTTAAQARTASALEVDLPRIMAEMGPDLAPVALFAALRECDLPVASLRYLSRMLDRRADEVERAADMRGG